MAVTPRQMLKYLFQEYGTINQGQTLENDERMKTQYDVAQPIETLFEQIKQGIELANNTDNPFSVQQVLTKVYNLTNKSGKYNEDLQD